MPTTTQTQPLSLALHAWSANELDFAKAMLEKVAQDPLMPEGLGSKQVYLTFADIFPSWLNLLLDANIPMKNILDGGPCHSRRFLEDIYLHFRKCQ